jgi:hypothetical protein
VDDIDGGGEEHRVAAYAGGVAQAMHSGFSQPTPPKKMALDFCSMKFRRKRFWICGRLIFFGQLHWN